MDDRQILLHLVATNINLPPGLKQNARNHFRKRNIKRYKAALVARKETLSSRPFTVTQPQEGGMYNATVDTGSAINIRNLLTTVQRMGLIHDQDITITECKFKYGRFQTAVTFSGKYAMAGNATKPLNSANFKARDSNGLGISFDFHKSGKVRFSGAFDPEKVRRFFAKYYPIPGEIKVNNRVVSFRIQGWRPILPLIHGAFSDAGGRFEKYEVRSRFMTKKKKTKTVGLPDAFLYLKFGEEFDAIMTEAGTVQIQGTQDYNDSYRVLKRFLLRLRNNEFMKPGATPVRTVKQRVVLSPDAPAPDVSRRGTTCPIDRRPDPYGYTGSCKANCYVKPNPQGQPCCYSVPKRIAYMQPRVKSAYNKAGIEIPPEVRRIFGIATTYHAKEVSTKIPEISFKGNKIDTRQCMRYTKVALMDMARRFRLIVPVNPTKTDLCQLIRDREKMPRELLTNIQKGFRLRNVRRQIAAEKVQRVYKYYKGRRRAAVSVKATAAKAVSPVKKPAGPALIKPTRKVKKASPVKKTSPVKKVSPVKKNKAALRAEREERKVYLYKLFNNLRRQGKNISTNNIPNLQYGNYNILEAYNANRAPLN